MKLYDSHIHLARLPQPLNLARSLHQSGYKYCAVACEPWEWTALDEIWENAGGEGWLEGCGKAYGIHPMIAAKIAGDLDKIMEDLRRRLEKDPNAQAGEAGLDKRYEGYEPGGVQEEIFRTQARMAMKFGRDLQIHCVGDYGRVIRILREVGFGAGAGTGIWPDAGVKLCRPVFHRFGADAGIVKAGLSLGAIFSIHADSFRKKATREALALIPAENLRFETDADESFVLDANEVPQQFAERLVQKLSETINALP